MSNIRESTARMGKARLASLVEYILAWCALNDVELREARQWVDMETGEIMRPKKSPDTSGIRAL